MASAEYGQRFRMAVGDPGGASPVFADTEIDDFFAQAESVYPNAGSQAHLAYAIIKGIEALMARAAAQVSYSANASSESLGQLFDHYKQLLDYWKKELDKALTTTMPGFAWVSLDKTPNRVEEYPE